jgi:hypothetical protein
MHYFQRDRRRDESQGPRGYVRASLGMAYPAFPVAPSEFPLAPYSPRHERRAMEPVGVLGNYDTLRLSLSVNG